MKTHEIQIQQNAFNAIHVPTTQEDNFGGIYRRFDLFHKFREENNGNETEKKIGHFVNYIDGSGAVCHGTIRYDFQIHDFIILTVS